MRELYAEGIERDAHAGAAGLDIAFLASPTAEEGGGARGRRKTCECGALGGREEVVGDFHRGEVWADALEVNANVGGVGEGHEGGTVGVREIEADRRRGSGGKVRFAVRAGAEAKGGGIERGVVAEKAAENGARGDEGVTSVRHEKFLGAGYFVGGEEMREVSAKVGGEEERSVPEMEFAGTEGWRLRDVERGVRRSSEHES